MLALVLTLAAVAGLASRMWLLGDKSLWLDEAWSWRAADISLSAMIDRTQNDVHPPLYYGVLHFWVALFGDSELSLRMPSAIAGAGSIVLATYAGWRLGGASLALLAAGLLILNPADLQFTQEARMYPLVGVLSMAATLLLWRIIVDAHPLWVVAYAGAAIALAYTHYSGFIVLAMHAPVFLWYGIARWRDGDWRVLASAVAAGAAVVIAYIPWWATFFDQSGHGVGHVPDASVTLAGATLRAALGLRQTQGFWLLLAAPLVASMAYGVWKRRDEPLLICIAATALVPVGLFVVSVLVKPSFDIKRVAPFIPAISVLAAIGISEAFDAMKRVSEDWRGAAYGVLGGFVAALAVVMVTGSVDWYRARPYEDWRAVAADIEAVNGPAYYYEGYLNDPLRYYVGESDHLVAIRDADAQSIFAAVVAGNQRAPSDDGVLIISHASSADERGIVELIRRTYGVNGEYNYDDSITVYILKRRILEGATP